MPRNGARYPDGDEIGTGQVSIQSGVFARTFCSICQTNHEWFAREAWVHEPEEEWRMSGPAFALSA